MLFLRADLVQLALLVFVAFAGFYYIVTSDLAAFAKGMAAVLLLLLSGIAIRTLAKADGWNGFVMVKTKEGIKIVELMKRLLGKYWNTLTDIGLVTSFGLSSIFAFKHLKPKTIAAAMLVLAAFVFLVMPFISVIALTLIDLPKGDAVNGGADSAFIALGIVAAFGFVGMIIYSLLFKAVSVIFSVIAFLFGNTTVLAGTTPGVQLIIPGLTLPLIEGIVALLVLLIVHEGGHGVSAMLSKVRIKSTGFLTFGVIPVGAFVDIDEKQLNKKKDADKLRVAVAGSTGNLLAAFIFFIPTVAILMMPGLYSNELAVVGFTRNVTAVGVPLSVDTRIYYVNNLEIRSYEDFAAAKRSIKPDSDVILYTNKGGALVQADSNGSMGLQLSQPIKNEFLWVKPIYNVLGLITVLNFFVGIINLLPVAAFDGYRLFDVGIKDKVVLRFISYAVMAAFAINILPWLWH
jgi:membrane-associated protease RseP (regulator of RpoE activity)